ADDALGRARLRLALCENLAFGIDRVADKDRRAQLDVGPAEIGDRLLADIGDAHPGDNRQGQAAVDDRPAELGFGGIGRIEMQRVLVHRQERKPSVVRLADRASGAVLVDIADREFLETAPGARAEAPRPDLSRDCASPVSAATGSVTGSNSLACRGAKLTEYCAAVAISARCAGPKWRGGSGN